MERVLSITDYPMDDGQRVAVGELVENQRHIGILHRTGGSQPEFLHLAWHCRLQNDAEVPGEMVFYVAPDVPAARQRSIAAFCRRVWRKNQRDGIPYAFSNPSESLDATTGSFLIGPSRFGLTCASFVLAIFDAAGFPLADLMTWPTDRPGDREWQESIVELIQKRAEPEHTVHLQNEIGSVRYRPEEVAACTALAPPAVDFARAEKLGAEILDRMRENM